MQNAKTVLGVIHERGKKGLPLERVYRQLFNPDLYRLAYGRIYRNRGAMTPGSTPETADGMSQEKIESIIDALRHERYHWTPVRRTYIKKKHSKKQRPLGLPTWSDKLVQEVLRLILDAYFDPQLSVHSHGFRHGHGCHTALREIYHNWQATAWFIEGDISQYFDCIDHQVLLNILAEKIHDGRFLRLIGELLKAGYLEDWKFNATLSGTPQGGVLSPVLANIYLDRLDKFVENTLLPAYNRGDKRRHSVEYTNISAYVRYHKRKGHYQKAKELRRKMQTMPSKDPNDPEYRRLRYVRYADDFLLGFNGPRSEAEEIKQQLGQFLRDTLKLELSESKTLITHARTQGAHFLGYEVTILQEDSARDRRGQRSINGQIGLKVPVDVIREKSQRYQKHGKPVHLQARTHDSVYSIVAQYQQEYRGIVQYYQMAYNLHRLNDLRWTMEQSLTKTLATKLKISVHQVYRRYQTTIQTATGRAKVLQVTVQREGKQPLVTHWGGIPLRWQIDAALDDQPKRIWNDRTELLERLLADTCELCGSRQYIQVHHVRHLKDLRSKQGQVTPTWVKVMAARHRKTLVVCRDCHVNIHAGRPTRMCGVD